MTDLFDMTGKSVLITGGSRGLGRAMAQGFAEAGADIAIVSRKLDACEAAAREIGQLGRRAFAYACHMARWDEIEPMFEAVWDHFGKVDVVVNNAGMSPLYPSLPEANERLFDAVVGVNFKGPFRLCAVAGERMFKGAGGSIINISSTAGQYGIGLRAPYVAAKWAVVGLTKTLAIELGPYGVRANAICPGSVDGDRMRGVIAREADARGGAAVEVEREYLEGQSIARFVQPAEIADLCLFLASDAARMISGQAIAVDGHTETFHIG
jgi:NAD(P)-dependent dehydrogenase (short-subunit alcohol dehydrogenase family)